MFNFYLKYRSNVVPFVDCSVISDGVYGELKICFFFFLNIYRSIEEEKYHYRLLGIVEHLGTMRGGHYVSYVRASGKSRGKTEKENSGSIWYHASDAYVREASLDEVLRCEAYILFYEKI